MTSGELVRLTEDGLPDTSFGNGAGVLRVPGQLLDTTPDGSMIAVLEDGWHLKRLLPNGRAVPDFSSAWTAAGEIRWAKVTPQGQIWVMTFSENGPELARLGSTGEPEHGFIPRKGLGLLPGGFVGSFRSPTYFDLDQEGRAYFRLDDSLEFGDPTQGVIVRFFADGRYDETYRPFPNGTVVEIKELDPDGTLLALVNGVELTEVDPSGRVRTLHRVTTSIGRAKRLSAGAILLSSVSCRPPGPFGGGGGCSEFDIRILAADGTVEQLGGRLMQQANHGFSPWYWEEHDNGYLCRADTHLRDPRVSLAHSGRYAVKSSASAVLQRAGNTANAATVRGRVFPLVAGQWDAAMAQPFEIEFPIGHADVELALPHFAQLGRQPLREFLVRLESATGLELSDFTACRLWVVDDEALPNPGGLVIERFVGKDEQGAALLMGRSVPGKTHHLDYRSRLDPPVILDFLGTSELGPVWVRPVQTSGSSSGFFRMITE